MRGFDPGSFGPFVDKGWTVHSWMVGKQKDGLGEPVCGVPSGRSGPSKCWKT